MVTSVLSEQIEHAIRKINVGVAPMDFDGHRCRRKPTLKLFEVDRAAQ